MKKPRHPVSDHAVLRYLEQIDGIDVEGVRRRIGATVKYGIEKGAGCVNHNGYRYHLKGSTVVTIVPQNQPELGTKKRKGRKPRA